MSAELVSHFADLMEFTYGIYKSSSLSTHKAPFPQDRKAVGSPVNPSGHRRNSVNTTVTITSNPPSSKSSLQQPLNRTTSMSPSMSQLHVILPAMGSGGREQHRKLDRSMSEPVDRNNNNTCNSSITNNSSQQVRPNQLNSSRYKTELCRPFEENGTCKYGDKCQFAHGLQELRTLSRHPKYKTELCRTFHSTGFCPYGPRCHFIHNSDESRKTLINSLQAQLQALRPDQSSNGLNNSNNHNNNYTHGPARPKALSIGSYSLGSAGDLSPPSSLSGSPTSLNSFFGEDPFTNFSPPQNTILSNGTAFPFTPDFAALVTTMKQNPLFGNSLQAALNPFLLNGGQDLSMASELFVNSGIYPDTITLADLDDGAPPSPVDSIDSDIECLSPGGSPEPSSDNILDSRGLPRLPIFSRLSTGDYD